MQTLQFNKELRRKKLHVNLKILTFYFSEIKLFKNLQGKEVNEISYPS